MAKTIALIHTAHVLIPIFQKLFHDVIPEVEVFNILDESLLRNTLRDGKLSEPGIHLTQVTPTSCSWAHSVLASQSATIERYGVGSTAMACCTRR